MPLWASLTPIAAAALLIGALVLPGSIALAITCVAALLGAVIAAVHHAEVIAHRLGEPFGAMVLAISITSIEVALIVALMLTGGPSHLDTWDMKPDAPSEIRVRKNPGQMAFTWILCGAYCSASSRVRLTTAPLVAA